MVLEGRCYEQESVPFKALDSLIDSLTVSLGMLRDDIIHSVMPRDRLALTRVFPVLGGIPEVANATYPSIENADQQELRQRAMNALRELLQRLAIREPLVLYVDDLLMLGPTKVLDGVIVDVRKKSTWKTQLPWIATSAATTAGGPTVTL